MCLCLCWVFLLLLCSASRMKVWSVKGKFKKHIWFRRVLKLHHLGGFKSATEYMWSRSSQCFTHDGIMFVGSLQLCYFFYFFDLEQLSSRFHPGQNLWSCRLSDVSFRLRADGSCSWSCCLFLFVHSSGCLMLRRLLLCLYRSLSVLFHSLFGDKFLLVLSCK